MLETTGVRLIAEERSRQLAEEGYDARHDRSHSPGELASAGAAYALLEDFLARTAEHGVHPITLWPWDDDSFKPVVGEPGARIKNLIRAGALIAAAIDRMIAGWPIKEKSDA